MTLWERFTVVVIRILVGSDQEMWRRDQICGEAIRRSIEASEAALKRRLR